MMLGCTRFLGDSKRLQALPSTPSGPAQWEGDAKYLTRAPPCQGKCEISWEPRSPGWGSQPHHSDATVTRELWTLGPGRLEKGKDAIPKNLSFWAVSSSTPLYRVQSSATQSPAKGLWGTGWGACTSRKSHCRAECS